MTSLGDIQTLATIKEEYNKNLNDVFTMMKIAEDEWDNESKEILMRWILQSQQECRRLDGLRNKILGTNKKQ